MVVVLKFDSSNNTILNSNNRSDIRSDPDNTTRARARAKAKERDTVTAATTATETAATPMTLMTDYDAKAL